MQIPSIHAGCGDFFLQGPEVLSREIFFKPVVLQILMKQKQKKKLFYLKLGTD